MVTGTQYDTGLPGKIKKFCVQRDMCKTEATVEQRVDFLTSLFEEGLDYSTINTVRAALSSVLTPPGGTTFGTHPLVLHFLKGVFELKP